MPKKVIPIPKSKKENTAEQEVVRLSKKVQQLRRIIAGQPAPETADPNYAELPY